MPDHSSSRVKRQGIEREHLCHCKTDNDKSFRQQRAISKHLACTPMLMDNSRQNFTASMTALWCRCWKTLRVIPCADGGICIRSNKPSGKRSRTLQTCPLPAWDLWELSGLPVHCHKLSKGLDWQNNQDDDYIPTHKWDWNLTRTVWLSKVHHQRLMVGERDWKSQSW